MDDWQKKLAKTHNRPIDNRGHRQDRSRDKLGGPPPSIPSEYIFDTFYIDEQKKKLRQELFYGSPEQLARIFVRSGLKPTALRRLYSYMQSFITPLKTGRIDFESAQERFGVFYTEGIIRQNKRKIIPNVVVELVDKHKSLILSCKEEMLGFFRYITSILCYFDEK